jgi:putative acetyltransferase
MLVRSAMPSDAAAIHAIHEAAFGGDAEARLVRMLEADGDVLVSLVASIEGATIGHVLFSWMTVTGDGEAIAAAGLAPVGVLPAYQDLGIGSTLIREGMARLPALGVALCFVLGHEGYYPRFGFSADCAALFASPYAGPHFMACPLDSALRLPERGVADYAPAFARLG